jgi:hypothetical protein
MSSFNLRLPQPPVSWSKAWADRAFNTIELLMNQVRISSESAAVQTSERQLWFIS